MYYRIQVSVSGTKTKVQSVSEKKLFFRNRNKFFKKSNSKYALNFPIIHGLQNLEDASKQDKLTLSTLRYIEKTDRDRKSQYEKVIWHK